MVVRMVAPHDLAILLSSCLSILLTPTTPFAIRYFYAKSSIPIVDRITLTPAPIIISILSLSTETSLLNYYHTNFLIPYLSRIFDRAFGSSTVICTPIAHLNLLRLKSIHAILAFSTLVDIYWDALVWRRT